MLDLSKSCRSKTCLCKRCTLLPVCLFCNCALLAKCYLPVLECGSFKDCSSILGLGFG
jgi:hypothetical protein